MSCRKNIPTPGSKKNSRKVPETPERASLSSSACLECTGRSCIVLQKYEALKDRIVDLGLIALENLTKNERYRLLVTEWLRKQCGEIRVTPNTLHLLKPEVKRRAMDRLHLEVGLNPKAKDIVHEVFRPPRKRRSRHMDF